MNLSFKSDGVRGLIMLISAGYFQAEKINILVESPIKKNYLELPVIRTYIPFFPLTKLKNLVSLLSLEVNCF